MQHQFPVLQISSVAEVASHGSNTFEIKCEVLKGKQGAADSLLFFPAVLDTEMSLFPDSPTHPQETGRNPRMVERMELAQTAWSLTVLQVSSAQGRVGTEALPQPREALNHCSIPGDGTSSPAGGEI